MNYRRALVALGFAMFAMLPGSLLCHAQDGSGDETTGVNSGNYNIQQTIEFGYRASEINGNIDTYNTFVNLGSGVRLFDYTLDMRSLNHNGLLFDDLNFSNFGYGGDPNDVTRLHIDKNKWYDFRLLFRRKLPMRRRSRMARQRFRIAHIHHALEQFQSIEAFTSAFVPTLYSEGQKRAAFRP